MFGPQTCRECFDHFGLAYTKKVLEALENNDEEVLAKLPFDFKPYSREELLKHAKEKVDQNDDFTVMY